MRKTMVRLAIASLAASVASAWAQGLVIGEPQQGVVVAPPAQPQQPPPQGNPNARDDEGFFRPGDFAFRPAQPTQAPAPARVASAQQPPVVVAVVPAAEESDAVELARLELLREQLRRTPPPIAGAFTGETSPESR